MRRTLIFLTGIISLVLGSAAARDYKVGSIDIAEPWSRATPRGASVAAGYMKITNKGTVADRLLSTSSEIVPKPSSSSCVDPSRTIRAYQVEAIQRRPEHLLRPAGDFSWNPLSRHLAEDVLLG